MKFFSALFKTTAHKANRKHFEKSKRKVQKEAYAETGNQLRKAKRKGTYIDGSAAYHNQYNRKIKAAKNQRDDFEYFLNNL